MAIVVEMVNEQGEVIEVPDAAASTAPPDAAALAAATTEESSPSPAAAQPSVEAAHEAASAPASESEEEEESEGVPRGVQRRIDRMRKQLGDAERASEQQRQRSEQQMAELRGRIETLTQIQRGDVAPPEVTPPQPRPEQYETEAAYHEALIDYRVEQKIQEQMQAQERTRLQQAEQQSMQQSRERLQTREAELRTQYTDYDLQVGRLGELGMTPTMFHALMDWEDGKGADLAYYLAAHPAEVRRLAPLQPLALMRALGRVESSLMAPPGSSTSSSSAAPSTPKPAPLSPVGSGAAGGPSRDLSDESLTHSEWMAEYNRTYGAKRQGVRR